MRIRSRKVSQKRRSNRVKSLRIKRMIKILIAIFDDYRDLYERKLLCLYL